MCTCQQANDLSRMHPITRDCLTSSKFIARHKNNNPVWLPRAEEFIEGNGGMDPASKRTYVQALRMTPAVVSKASTVPVVKAGWEGMAPFEWRIGMRKWPGFMDLRDDSQLEACFTPIAQDYLANCDVSQERLMEHLAPAGLPERIPYGKDCSLMPINHGRAIIMRPAQLSFQRDTAKQAHEAGLQQERDLKAVDKTATAEAKKAAKKEERDQRTVAKREERERKSAVKTEERERQATAKTEEREWKEATLKAGRKRKASVLQVTCSNTIGCRAVRVEGTDASLWSVCGHRNCPEQFCGSELCKSVLVAHRQCAHGAT